MDWEAAIEWNRAALVRVLAMLVAMTGLADGEPGGTLPRHLHRAVLRLLRPAEAATRRLVIAAARGLVVAPVPPPLTPPLKGEGAVRVAHGSPAYAPSAKGAESPSPLRGGIRGRGRCLTPPPSGFRLFDPLPRHRLRRACQSGVPRISVPGFTRLFPVAVRPPPSPDDPIDATRLGLRLSALGRILDDLPRQANRFARWQARLAQGAENRVVLCVRDSGRRACLPRRVWPLRPGRPPGGDRRSGHQVHTVLKNTHGLALWALGHPDTS